MVILEENFKWHLEAFASELFKYYDNLCLTDIGTKTILQREQDVSKQPINLWFSLTFSIS